MSRRHSPRNGQSLVGVYVDEAVLVIEADADAYVTALHQATQERRTPAMAPHAPQPCPGPCNRRWRVAQGLADHERATAAVEGRPTDRAITAHGIPAVMGAPVWCVDLDAYDVEGRPTGKLAHHGCTTRITGNLADLPQLATWLMPGKLNTPRSTDIDRTSSKSGGAKAIAHAPSPSPGWDTADELIRWLVGLEDWTRAQLGDDVNDDDQRRLGDAVRYLGLRGTNLLATVDAATIGQDILDQHRRLTTLVGQDVLVHRLPEPCLRCDRKGLQRKDGGDIVTCRSCGASWDWEQFGLLGRAYAETVQTRGRGAGA